MKPVKTARSNFVYRGPTLDIGDAWVVRVTVRLESGPVNVVYMDWQPTPEDLAALVDGKGVIRLGIWGMEPIPPVSLEVRTDLEIVDDAPPTIEEPGR